MAEPIYREETIGARQSTRSNAIFVNLRAGYIARTTNEDMTGKEGWSEEETENSSGTKFKFWAFRYDDLAGYIKEIKWHEHDFTDGVSRSWWIVIDVDGQEYILDLKSTDRPFTRTMAALIGINFDRPVRFMAFMGKHPTTKKKQKVLLLYQGLYDPETNKPIPVQPLYSDRWISLDLVAKLKKHGISTKELAEKAVADKVLNDAEFNNLAFDADGKINKDYPYIRQNEDKTWNFTDWTNFLMRKMKEEVIPAVESAQSIRNQARGDQQSVAADATPEFSGGPVSDANPAAPVEDDDIPF